MNPAGWQWAQGPRAAVIAALASLLLASCTSATDPFASVAAPGYAANGDSLSPASSMQRTAGADSSVSGPPQTLMSPQGDTPLPEQVASVPATRPAIAEAAADLTIPAPDGSQQIAASMPEALTPEGETAEETEAVARKVAAGDASLFAGKPADAQDPAVQPPADGGTVAYAAPAPQPPQKKSFLAAFFGASSGSSAASSRQNQPVAQATTAKPLVQPVSADAPALVDTDSARQAVKPVIELASAEANQPLIAPSADNGLPGVRRQTALFEITRKSGTGDDSDVDVNEDEGGSSGSFQVAYAAGLARLAPNGLLKQNESVDVACLKPSLVRMLKTIEGHFGRKLVVTSGFRDPGRNMRARGAKNSLHMYCAAADIEIPGVSKWDLANYARSMPGRGGVGTYCYTDAVHVDVGPERDWNWRCRRRSRG